MSLDEEKQPQQLSTAWVKKSHHFQEVAEKARGDASEALDGASHAEASVTGGGTGDRGAPSWTTDHHGRGELERKDDS